MDNNFPFVWEETRERLFIIQEKAIPEISFVTKDFLRYCQNNSFSLYKR